MEKQGEAELAKSTLVKDHIQKGLLKKEERHAFENYKLISQGNQETMQELVRSKSWNRCRDLAEEEGKLPYELENFGVL